MSSMGHYHADSEEPLTPEELALARRLMSDPMAVIGSQVFAWIKDYISVQPCCGGGAPAHLGHRNALIVKERAGSWYGMGDGSTVNGSLVHNYGSGPDAVFIGPGTDPHTGTPGTNGASSGWSLAEDAASYTGEQKNTSIPGGYEVSPGVSTYDHLQTSASFTINMWMLYAGAEVRFGSVGSGIDVYGASTLYGWRNAGDVGLWIYIDGGVVNYGDPRPAPNLICKIGDGSSVTTVNAGLGASDGGYHMVTVVVDGAAKTISIYIDGGFVVSSSYIETDQSNNTPGIGLANFGGFLGANGSTWYGLIDEVGVWIGEALNGGDIADLYAG